MDKKALSILFKTYWQNGCKDTYSTDPADFAYAKDKGLMFESFSISHDECVARIMDSVSSISHKDVAGAFLSSLSTRRLELRSAVASWKTGNSIPPHNYTPVEMGYSYENGVVNATHYSCGVCKDAGVIGHENYRNKDLSVLNFERIKWGGVRHGDLLYTLFDLDQFLKAELAPPKNEDIAIFRAILKVISESAPGDYPSRLRERFAVIPGFKSSKNERDAIIEILACIGVLEPKSHTRPIRGRNDWNYAEYWRGEDKYNIENVRYLFGEYVDDLKESV